MALAVAPATLTLNALVGGALISNAAFHEAISLLPACAGSILLLASVALLVVDLALRATGLRNAILYGLACGLSMVAVSLVVSMPVLYRLLFVFAPGFVSGLVLGWSRR
ncbi:hypothetical protein [Caulobacter segnis]